MLIFVFHDYTLNTYKLSTILSLTPLLIQHLVFEIHRKYLAHVAEELILTKLPSQKQHSQSHASNTVQEYQEIVSRFIN